MHDDKRAVDRHNLRTVLYRIRAELPDAVTVSLESSDQGLYGFILGDIANAAGNPLRIPAELEDELDELLCDLDWDGVVGEDPRGYATLPL